LPHEFHHLLGEIDQLDALIGRDDEGLTMNRQTARLHSRHVLDWPLAHGDGRTFAHYASSLVRGRNSRRPRVDTNWQCYVKEPSRTGKTDASPRSASQETWPSGASFFGA